MAVQYPKNEHITLPSVEGWGSNMNILRDPPKSISTRRIDKVEQDMKIAEMIDESGDRICDGINLYARGVNPMVSVSYDNNSNNAGMSSSIAGSGLTSNISAISTQQSRLPYSAFDNGAFRPPVRTQRDLLPLSRLPRAWVETKSTPGFVNYAKTKQENSGCGYLRAIKELLNAYDVKPNKSTVISKNIVENFKMNDTINNRHINVEANAGYQSEYQSTYTRENADQYKGTYDEVLNAYAQSNIGKNISHNLEGFQIDKDRYIQDALAHSANTNLSINRPQNLDNVNVDTSRHVQDIKTFEMFSNLSSDVNKQTLEKLYDNGRVSVKDNMIQYETKAGISPGYTFLNEIATPVLEMRNPQFEVTAQLSDPTVYKRVRHENELVYERNTPLTNAKTNITKIEDFNSINLSSRDMKLYPTLQKGGFNNNGVKPTTQRPDLIHHKESDKDRLRQSVKQFAR